MERYGQLSKHDIRRERKLNGGLRIYPFRASCLKGASYDLTPTIVGMSVEYGMLEKVYRERKYPFKHYIYVKPKDTVLAVSYEYLAVPEYIAGYVVSRVSKVVEGFGHVSTSIDPNWKGSALIALNNPTKRPIKVYVGRNALGASKPNPLATVSFHYLNTPCKPEEREYHQGMRLDLLKALQYKNRRGVKAWLRRIVCKKRRDFTDFFFEFSERIPGNIVMNEKSWTKFVEELTDVPLEAPNRASGGGCAYCKNYSEIERKGNAQVWDFVIKESFASRGVHFFENHFGVIKLLIKIIVLILVVGVSMAVTWSAIELEEMPWLRTIINIIFGGD